MGKGHVVPITNGKGSKELINGSYDVVADVEGYDNSTINPATQEITEAATSYNFTIKASGTLTLHVTDDGTDIGVPVEGAVFYRCDYVGNVYGDPIITDEEGNAVLKSVPYSTSGNPPTVYFKQTESDGEHTFDDALQGEELDTDSKTVEIRNSDATLRSINLTDATYANLPIADGNLTFKEQ